MPESAVIEGVTFTASVKEELAYPLRARFEDQTIRIPDSEEIISDLRAIKKTVGVSGQIRFDASRNENGHADRFWALALACEASSSKTQSFIESVEMERSRRYW